MFNCIIVNKVLKTQVPTSKNSLSIICLYKYELQCGSYSWIDYVIITWQQKHIHFLRSINNHALKRILYLKKKGSRILKSRNVETS